MNYLFYLLATIILLVGCGEEEGRDSDAELPHSMSNEGISGEEGTQMPVSLGDLPNPLNQSRRAIRDVGLKFLKNRRESNRSIAAIMGQCAAETEDFRYMYELGGRKYLMYLEGRRDLGNTQPGDGPRFKGRGYIHLTGRANYRQYGKKTGLDLIRNPQLAERADYAILIMHHYLLSRRYGDTGYGHARRGNIRKLTNHINGGRNGYTKRIRYYNQYLAQLNAGKFNHLFGQSTPRPPSATANRRGNL